MRIPNLVFICPLLQLDRFYRWCLPFVCRLPSLYPRVLSEVPAVAHWCDAGFLRSDSECPRCKVYPFKRPAGGVG